MTQQLELALFEPRIVKPTEDIAIPKPPKNWDFRKTDLNRLNYLFLEHFFYGWHNLDMDAGMFDVLNPDEISAKLVGAGILKRYNYHLSCPDLSHNFFHLVRQIDEEVYKMDWASASANWKKRFEHKPMQQQKRLATLDDSVMKRFVDSFFENYRASNREEPSNPNAFYDPNIDGKNKTIYADRLYKFIGEKYQEMHKDS